MLTTFDPRSPRGAVAHAAPLGTLKVTGGDQKSWLNGLLTCDVAKLSPGQGAYGLSTTKVGRVQGDVVVLVTSGCIYVGCSEGRAAALRELFDGYLIMEDAEISDESGAVRWVLLHGPEAASAAAKASSRAIAWAPVDVLGGAGAAMAASGEGLEGLLAALREEGVEVVGDEAFEALRIERGAARFGVDFDDKTYPQEASLERRAVSFDKGCYLGQEVVCRLEMRGHVHRRLVALSFGDGAAPRPGDEVTHEGNAVGAVTSATTTTHHGRAVAIAMVKYAASEPGTKLAVGGAEAVVTAEPWRGGER